MRNGAKHSRVAQLERRAKRRLPSVVHAFFDGGVDEETCYEQNRQVLDSVKLLPNHLSGAIDPDLTRKLLGQTYDAPFGVAPISFSALIWPLSARILAEAAGRHNVPYALGTFAFSSPERIFEIARGNAWLQLYLPADSDMELALLNRAKSIGYRVLVVTVDCPAARYRKMTAQSGFWTLPRLNLKTALQLAARPAWSLSMIRAAGGSDFGLLQPFVPPRSRLPQAVDVLTEMIPEQVSIERLKQVRDRWPGKLVVKGILSAENAWQCAAIGADGIVVSNHGGRQLDAAPHALDVIADIRRAVGPDVALLADGGVRSGLDVARMIAAGTDFVLIGRAFMYGVAALGAAGGHHMMETLKNELKSTMLQIGCSDVDELPRFLMGRSETEQESRAAHARPPTRLRSASVGAALAET